MPHKPRTPSYRLHKPSGRAVVTLNGKDHYLGPVDAPESRQRYDQLIADWLSRGRRLPESVAQAAPEPITVAEVAARFLDHAKVYYRDAATGKPTTEFAHYPLALKPVIASFGRTPAVEFGPLRFRAIREAFVASGWSRKHCNSQADRIRRMFRWAVGDELVPASVYDALKAVPGLKRGRTEARDNPPVQPVGKADVEATKAHLSTPLRLAVELQELTAARPGEILSMRPMDVDRTDSDVWVYVPERHKTAMHGHARKIYLGPRAQTLVAPYLLNREPGDYIVSPKEGMAEYLENRKANRKTPPSCGNKPGSNRRKRPQRRPRERYDVAGYRTAIKRACERAEVTPWHPHRLRHTAATELRREFGLEVASILMGHRDVGISQVYAERDESKAREVARKVG